MIKKNNKGDNKRPDFPRGKRPQSVYRGKHYRNRNGSLCRNRNGSLCVHKDKKDKVQDPKYYLDKLEEYLEYKEFEQEMSRSYWHDWYSQPLE